MSDDLKKERIEGGVNEGCDKNPHLDARKRACCDVILMDDTQPVIFEITSSPPVTPKFIYFLRPEKHDSFFSGMTRMMQFSDQTC